MKPIYCILISCTVLDGTIAIEQHINDYATFVPKVNSIKSNTWVAADKTGVCIYNMEVYNGYKQ